MVVTPEVRVARVEHDGRQLRMSLFRGAGEEHVTVRMTGEVVQEVWIGDTVCAEKAVDRRDDVYGVIARKAREFALLLTVPQVQRVEVVDGVPQRWIHLGDILAAPDYPELGDLDSYPEAGDGLDV